MPMRLCYESNKSPVWRAAYNGNAEEVQQLMSSGVDFYSLEANCVCTPLQIAVWRGNTRVVRVLLANAGNYTTTAGVFFCPAVHIADVQGHYPLHYAMRGLHIEIAMLLIAYGADANLNIAVEHEHRFLVRSPPQESPVLWAARSKLPRDDHACSGHNCPTTSVEWADRRIEMMRLLFSHGAEVHPPETDGGGGYFDLWKIAIGLNQYREDDSPDMRMLELLIEYDTSRLSHMKPGEWTLAHTVAAMNYWERRYGHDIAALVILEAHGYNLQGNTESRRTPLHIAACGSNRVMVQFLLDSGVDLEGENFMNRRDFGGPGECWDLITRAHYGARQHAFAARRGDLPEEVVKHVFSFIGPRAFL
jgi:hypothetical protein